MELLRDVINTLKHSICRDKNQRFLFHLPIGSVFRHSYFQWAETNEELKQIFYYSLLIYRIIDAKTESDIINKKIKLFSLIDQAVTSEMLFQLLNEYLNTMNVEFQFDVEKCFFGNVNNLYFDCEPFSKSIRNNFRKYMYDINFEDEMNMGSKSISVMEAIKFQEFLTEPSVYFTEYDEK